MRAAWSRVNVRPLAPDRDKAGKVRKVERFNSSIGGADTPPISMTTEPDPMTRHAACSCGQLHLTIEGEPSRISMCH